MTASTADAAIVSLRESEMVQILDPTGVRQRASTTPGGRVGDLRDKVAGIVSNHWKSMDEMAKTLQSVLRSQYRVRDVRFYDSPINHAISEEILGKAVGECDIAIVGLGN